MFRSVSACMYLCIQVFLGARVYTRCVCVCVREKERERERETEEARERERVENGICNRGDFSMSGISMRVNLT